MNLGIAGAGMIVKEALPVLKQLQISLKGIWARNEENLRNLADMYNIEAYYTDYGKLLNNQEIDTIYVAVPNKYHYEFAKQALLKGKNVICEKPFTSNLAQFMELRQLAAKEGVFLLEAITTYYLPAFSKLKEILATGKLGKLHLANINFSQYSSRYDNFKKGIIAPVFDPKAEGGVLRDLNIYNLHLLCGLFGTPAEVHYYPQMEQGVDTSGVLFLQFPEVLATATASKATKCENFVELQGEQASLLIYKPANEMGDITIVDRNKNIKLYAGSGNKHRMYYEFVAFKEIIQGKDNERGEAALNHSQVVMQVLDKAIKYLK